MSKRGNEVSLFYPAQKVLCFEAADDDLLWCFTVRFDDQSAIEVMLDIGDAFAVEDELPVRPEEVVGAQHVFQLVDGILHTIILIIAGMEGHHPIGRMNIGQIGDLDRNHFLPVVYEDRLAIGIFHLGHGLRKVLLIGAVVLFDPVVFLQTLFYHCFFQWLQQVVDAVRFEGLNGILVKSCAENNGGIDSDFPVDLKAESIAQLYIREYKVRCRIFPEPAGSGGHRGQHFQDADLAVYTGKNVL